MKDTDELLKWLAYRFPGIYREWVDHNQIKNAEKVLFQKRGKFK